MSSDLRKVINKAGRRGPPVGKRSTGPIAQRSGQHREAAEDGEVQTSTGRNSRARRSPHAPYAASSNPRVSAARKKETTVVEISNLTNRNEQELLQFLASKASFTPVKTLWVDSCFMVTCKTTKEAWALKQLDGSTFNGAKIATRYVYGPTKEDRPETRAKLLVVLDQLIKHRYDAPNRFLNLERMVEEPSFQSTGSKGFSDSPLSSKFGPVLCKMIGTICPEVQTISFASNHISNLEFFSQLASYIPNLINVSFKDNTIASYDQLKGFHGAEYTQLRELILEGNPLRTREVEKHSTLITYASNIKSLFPSIKMLDGQALLDEIQFGLETPSSLPVTVKTGFSDSTVTLSAAQMFLLQFYELFDNNRSGLSNYYEDASCFSVTVPKLSKSAKKDTPGPELLFKQWLPFDRSLNRVTQAGMCCHYNAVDKRVKHLHHGTQAIMNVFQALPPTKHPLHEPPEKKKFIFDTFQQGAGSQAYLYIFVHGEVG
ncbi:nuclear mRNA export, poly(A)+RNA binding protein, partial [Kappamyces sp. JEL0680]